MEPAPKIDRDEVTPPSLYFNRRTFMRASAAAGSVAATAGIYRALNPTGLAAAKSQPLEPTEPTKNSTSEGTPESSNQAANTHSTGADTTTEIPAGPEQSPELSKEQLIEKGYLVEDAKTPELYITNYNNFYEFTTSKEGVASAAAGFSTDGWSIKVDGLVDKPTTFTIDQLQKLGPLEERIYRMRCVEGWSMIIPWIGIQLSHLLEAVAPQSSAKYVAFETLLDPQRMPGQRRPILQWPYVEGLRLDEAMHPLTILATGLYRQALPAQDGAPVRLVVPWKYGFKGIKSIVRISLVEQEPPTSWNLSAPNEYGFYANVNPKVDHPRWSQATELRIGENRRRATLMFNGYETQVAQLYKDMDLRRFF